MEINQRKEVKIAVIAATLLTVFAIASSEILALFGITIYSFMVAGGILLFIVSIELLTHGAWRFSAETRREVTESGVVPLAFPLLAGPGAITSVMISFQMLA
jgi:multiple antibiotic resistance protein